MHGEDRQRVAQEAERAFAAEAVVACGHGEGHVEGDGRPLTACERLRQSDAQRRALHAGAARSAAAHVGDADGGRSSGCPAAVLAIAPQAYVHLTQGPAGGVAEGHRLPARPVGAVAIGAQLHVVAGAVRRRGFGRSHRGAGRRAGRRAGLGHGGACCREHREQGDQQTATGS